jgi:hypothetical protein
MSFFLTIEAKSVGHHAGPMYIHGIRISAGHKGVSGSGGRSKSGARDEGGFSWLGYSLGLGRCRAVEISIVLFLLVLFVQLTSLVLPTFEVSWHRIEVEDLGPKALVESAFVLLDQSYVTEFGPGFVCVEEGGKLLARLSPHGDGPQDLDRVALNVSPLEVVEEGLFEILKLVVYRVISRTDDELLLPIGPGRGDVVSPSPDE